MEKTPGVIDFLKASLVPTYAMRAAGKAAVSTNLASGKSQQVCLDALWTAMAQALIDG